MHLLAGRFAETDLALEKLSIFIREGDDHQRKAQDFRRYPGQSIECFVRQGVEQPRSAERGKAPRRAGSVEGERLRTGADPVASRAYL